MAATIKDEFDLEVALIEGAKGVFDVVVDDRLVFSKHAEGRFPDEREIVELLRMTGS